MTAADYERAASVDDRFGPLIVGQPSSPTWIGAQFWYGRSVEGGNEWLLFDAAAASKAPLFDHARMAAAVSVATDSAFTALTLPFTGRGSRFEVEDDRSAVTFVLSGSAYRCTLSSYECTRTGAAQGGGRGGGGRGGGRGGGPPPDTVLSPDSQWVAAIRNHNLAVRPAGDPRADYTLLSHDGSEGGYYMLSSIEWSPDSRKLVAYRRTPGYARTVYFIRTSPEDQVQPKLETTQSLNDNPASGWGVHYRKPGDVVDHDRPALFDVASRTQLVIDDRLFPNPYEIGGASWWEDGRGFTFEYNERGHTEYRVIEVDATTGEARALIDENPSTFFNYSGTRWREDVNDGHEILWRSERDGWKHIWLYDGITGQVKSQVTNGEWIVRGVDSVDVANRQVWFRASGMVPGKDPYFIHYYRINFDGTGLTTFTEGDGTHEVVWSPDRQYYVDTWSRVDQPPVMELRRTSDRSLVIEVERADVGRLEAEGWQRPEPFVAKGRDGTTDIWGVIVRPSNFDPSRKYPVIENIYAGPQGSFAPKSFGVQSGMQSLAELGFIVVQLDGMGTNNRSKAFHDVAWKNLADAGFPDRILWHQAVAAKYPYYDITRVGIYGTSAGGQNAAGAVLFHPEFYDVAVSASGSHDNRMDKIWWNELWMSWPLGPHYEASSNVVNAHRLKGRLMLVVGELDSNVDPASTFQVVDALIDADKDFDLLYLPGAGHTNGGRYGTRKRNDYFVRHLLGVEPPAWNALITEATDGSEDWLQVPESELYPRGY